MSIEQFISVFSLIIACIALGYTIGKDLNKQKQPPKPEKQGGYFANVNWANRLSVVPSILR